MALVFAVADAMPEPLLLTQGQVYHLLAYDILVHHAPQLNWQTGEEQRLALCLRTRIDLDIGFRCQAQRGFARAHTYCWVRCR